MNKELLYTIQDIIEWPFKKIKRAWRFSRNLIRNIQMYWPILKQDHDWDCQPYFKLLRVKIAKQADSFRKYAQCVGSGKRVKQMEFCLKLIDRIIEDRYDDIAYYFHDKKWGRLEITCLKEHPDDKYSRIVFSRKNVITEEDKKKEDKERKICVENEEYLRRQDLEYLFTYLSKHIRTWWD